MTSFMITNYHLISQTKILRRKLSSENDKLQHDFLFGILLLAFLQFFWFWVFSGFSPETRSFYNIYLPFHGQKGKNMSQTEAKMDQC